MTDKRTRLAKALFKLSVAAKEGEIWEDKTAQVQDCYFQDVDTILREQIEMLEWQIARTPAYDLKAAKRVLKRWINERETEPAE